MQVNRTGRVIATGALLLAATAFSVFATPNSISGAMKKPPAPISRTLPKSEGPMRDREENGHRGGGRQSLDENNLCSEVTYRVGFYLYSQEAESVQVGSREFYNPFNSHVSDVDCITTIVSVVPDHMHNWQYVSIVPEGSPADMNNPNRDRALIEDITAQGSWWLIAVTNDTTVNDSALAHAILDSIRIVPANPLPTLPESWSFTVYPNPLNGSGRITFSASKTGSAKFSVFNVLGQREAVIYDGAANPGENSFGFTLSGTSGAKFIRYEDKEGNSKTEKVLLLK